MKDDKLASKIIVFLNRNLPQRKSEIVKGIKGEKKINLHALSSKVDYKLRVLEELGIVTSFDDGNKTMLYKLTDIVEIIEGKVVLKTKDGEELYEEEATVLRMTDENGEIYLSFL
jgi:DNA-binding transcriptional ArsR family regulator